MERKVIPKELKKTDESFETEKAANQKALECQKLNVVKAPELFLVTKKLQL